ncbi:response regulator transcription factor [Microlunatus ginsengisoli]|uniref:Response regulator transcription factor n=1 Tax=Microlunatus ginsengisoli TaxID=363863 RepID=A0ABP6ZU82_9ACTN
MRVLVVEDDPNLRTTLVEALRHEGYLVSEADEGGQALSTLATSEIDLVLLDRDLPGMNGDAVCRTMVSIRHPARILMLTAAADMAQRVAGLDLGADDYLAKPFGYPELLARMRALTRRDREQRVPTVWSVGDLTVDTVRRFAERGGRPLRLTPKEFAVLDLLLAADGGYVDVDDLLDQVWEDPLEQSRGVVKVTVYGLRKKLGAPPLIEYEAGFGYRLSGDPPAAGRATASPA